MRGLANNRAACSSIFYWATFSGRIAGPTACDNHLHHDSISFGDNPDVKWRLRVLPRTITNIQQLECAIALDDFKGAIVLQLEGLRWLTFRNLAASIHNTHTLYKIPFKCRLSHSVWILSVSNIPTIGWTRPSIQCKSLYWQYVEKNFYVEEMKNGQLKCLFDDDDLLNWISRTFFELGVVHILRNRE